MRVAPLPQTPGLVAVLPVGDWFRVRGWTALQDKQNGLRSLRDPQTGLHMSPQAALATEGERLRSCLASLRELLVREQGAALAEMLADPPEPPRFALGAGLLGPNGRRLS